MAVSPDWEPVLPTVGESVAKAGQRQTIRVVLQNRPDFLDVPSTGSIEMRHRNISWWRKWDWRERETWLTWGWNSRRIRMEIKLQWDLGYGGRIEMGFLGAWFNLTHFTRDIDLQRQFLREFAASSIGEGL